MDIYSKRTADDFFLKKRDFLQDEANWKLKFGFDLNYVSHNKQIGLKMDIPVANFLRSFIFGKMDLMSEPEKKRVYIFPILLTVLDALQVVLLINFNSRHAWLPKWAHPHFGVVV